MKTLILIMAAALASPAFGHDCNCNSNTSGSSTSAAPIYEDSEGSTSASRSGTGSAMGSSASSVPVTEEESSMSGSSTALSDDSASFSDSDSSSSLSGSSTDDSSMSGSSLDSSTSGTSTNDDANLSGSTTTMDSEEVSESSTTSLSGASGTTTDATATSPSMAAPATATPAAAAPAPAATAETTSRTYQESDTEERNVGGLFLEPGIFGSQQDNDIKGAAIGADQTGESTGFGGDLKFGGHVNEILFLAANARYERSQFEESSLGDADADIYNWGPTIGLQAPFMGVRAWGTYVIDGSADPEAAANGVNLKFDDPYGWRVGAGIRLSAVSLNVEYQDLTYRTTEVQGAGTAAAAADEPIDFSQRGYAVSLSFPFEL